MYKTQSSSINKLKMSWGQADLTRELTTEISKIIVVAAKKVKY